MVRTAVVFSLIAVAEAGSSCVNDDAATSDDVYKDCNIMELQNTPPGAGISTLVAAVVAGDLVDSLTSPGPYTIFAPSNKAFEELPAGVVDNLLKPENKAALVSLLNYHVLPKQVRSKDWKPTQVVKTVEGKTLHVVVDATGKTCPQQPGSKQPPFICVSVGPSLKDLKKQVATSEFLLSNAAMYLIDGVLLSPTSMPPIAEELPPAANVTVQHDCKKACDCSCWSPEYRHPSGHAGKDGCVCLKDHAPFYYKKCCGKSDILV